MPAYGIEKLGKTIAGNDEYRVVFFQFRWQAVEWEKQKPKRRLAHGSALDTYLIQKSKQQRRQVVTDARRSKSDERERVVN